ncbi:MAG: Ldh family oxidoreductase, partial [Kiritimatiellae bacterium]|nr:Ldh family oxidoreductase [Kiritimatiellia bacterium]
AASDVYKRQRPEVLKDTGPCVLVEGHHSLGYAAGRFCAQLLVERTILHGVACVGLRNTRHTGMLGYYTDMAARAGSVTFAFANCYPLVAPYGGTHALLGTNPISLAFPAKPDPILVDMATSAISLGEVLAREEAGEKLPVGVALDAEGRPTTDPAMARTGCLLPFGGHKGGALIVAVQLLAGLLAGSPAIPPFGKGYGLLLVGLKKDLFRPAEDYDEALAEFIARYHSVPSLPGHRVRLPGALRYSTLRSRSENFLEISESLAEMLDLRTVRPGTAGERTT